MTLTARNEGIVEDILRGKSIGWLAKRHDLSTKTIWAIFKKETGQTIREARGYVIVHNRNDALTDAELDRLLELGLSHGDIGRRFGMSQQAVSQRLKARSRIAAGLPGSSADEEGEGCGGTPHQEG